MVRRRPAAAWRPFRAPAGLPQALRAAAANAEYVMMLPGWGEYGLFRMSQSCNFTCPGIGRDIHFRGIQFVVRRKSQAPSRSNRLGWGVAKCWQPYNCTVSGRPELGIKLYRDYREFHTTYHRLVAVAMLQHTYWDDLGNLLDVPRYIRNW